MGADKVECLNPVEGKASVHIDRWKDDRLRQVILAILPAEPPGVRFADLPGLIDERLNTDERTDLVPSPGIPPASSSIWRPGEKSGARPK